MSKIQSIEDRREEQRRARLRSGLPPADTSRWVASRKAAVVLAVEAGAISPEAACARYGLSAEELDRWRESVARHGAGALLVTKSQHFRNTHGG